MKVASLLLAIVIILCPPVFGAEPQVGVKRMGDGSVVLTLPPEIVKQCESEGGSKLVSRDEMVNFVQKIKPALCNEKEI